MAGGDDGNIKVAVRVRPFNKREKGKNCKLVIGMTPPGGVQITSSEKGPQKFNFDHAFWTHNGEGTERYKSQGDVFNDIGQSVVDSAFAGFNCSLFAYGQTGSGKTYTMMGGPGEHKGLIPRICEAIFDTANGKAEATQGYKAEMEVSFMEIYNEKVYDLLGRSTDKKGNKKGLKVSRHPVTGPYVVGLSKHAADGFESVDKLITLGMNTRTVAATKMNKESSRSHSIFTLYFTQTVVTSEEEAEVLEAQIHLIDLAGSERQSKTGATGQQLKEATKINQSLSSLRNVINALVKKRKHVPYRDSQLTYLLEESLGGNAKTIMLAALSPADDNYEETLGTLRYASSAKSIVNKARKNATDKGAQVRALNEMIAKLKSQLADSNGNGSAQSQEEVQALNAELQDRNEAMRRMQMSFEDKVKEMAKYKEERTKELEGAGLALKDLAGAFNNVDENAGRLTNVSLDPQLSGVLVYFLKAPQTTIGTGMAADKQDIVLESTGFNVAPKHAIVTVTEDNSQIFIESADPDDPNIVIRVNGKPILARTKLWHGDTLFIGANYAFQLMHGPSAREERKGVQMADMTEVLKERDLWRKKFEEADEKEREKEELQQQVEQKASENERLAAQLREEQEDLRAKYEAQMAEAADLQRQLDKAQLKQSSYSAGAVDSLKDQLNESREAMQHLMSQQQEDKAAMARELDLAIRKRAAKAEEEAARNLSEWKARELKLAQDQIKAEQEQAYDFKLKMEAGDNLMVADIRSSDPYVRIRVMDKFGNQLGCVRTTYFSSSLYPRWNERFNITRWADQAHHIIFDVWDYDKWSEDDFMGTCTIYVSKIPVGKKSKFKQPLGDKKGSLTIGFDRRVNKLAAAAAAGGKPLKNGGGFDFFMNREMLWNLDGFHLEKLWKEFDVNKDGSLDGPELPMIANQFFSRQVKTYATEMDMSEDQALAHLLAGQEQKKRIKNITNKLLQDFDNDKDGKISKDEFMRKWNAVASTHLRGKSAENSACSIM